MLPSRFALLLAESVVRRTFVHIKNTSPPYSFLPTSYLHRSSLLPTSHPYLIYKPCHQRTTWITKRKQGKPSLSPCVTLSLSRQQVCPEVRDTLAFFEFPLTPLATPIDLDLDDVSVTRRRSHDGSQPDHSDNGNIASEPADRSDGMLTIKARRYDPHH